MRARACTVLIKVAAPAGRKSRRGKKPRKERLTGNRKEPFEETSLGAPHLNMLILRQRCSPRLSPPRLVSSWIGFGIPAFFEFGVVVGKLARGSEGLMLLCRRALYVF